MMTKSHESFRIGGDAVRFLPEAVRKYGPVAPKSGGLLPKIPTNSSER